MNPQPTPAPNSSLSTLNFLASTLPTQSELRGVANKIDELISALRRWKTAR